MKGDLESNFATDKDNTTEYFINTVIMEIEDCTNELGKMKLTK